MRAATDEYRVEIDPPVPLAQQLQRAHHVIDAVLRADLAEIDQEMPFALPIADIGRKAAEPAEIRAGADHDDVLRRPPAARGGDQLMALIGGDDDVGRPHALPLEPQQAAVEQPVRAPEFDGEHLRTQVVMIVDEPPAEQLPEPTEQPERVGRIAGVQHIEAAAEQLDPEAQQRRQREAPGEFRSEPERALGLERDRVAEDVHILDRLVRPIKALRLRADHRDAVAVTGQRRRF